MAVVISIGHDPSYLRVWHCRLADPGDIYWSQCLALRVDRSNHWFCVGAYPER